MKDEEQEFLKLLSFERDISAEKLCYRICERYKGNFDLDIDKETDPTLMLEAWIKVSSVEHELMKNGQGLIK